MTERSTSTKSKNGRDKASIPEAPGLIPRARVCGKDKASVPEASSLIPRARECPSAISRTDELGGEELKEHLDEQYNAVRTKTPAELSDHDDPEEQTHGVRRKADESLGGFEELGNTLEEETAVRRKTQAEKELIAYRRHQQILTYKSLVTREERQKRYNSRHGIAEAHNSDVEGSIGDPISVPSSRSASPSKSSEQSPRKKKRVSFDAK